MGDGYTMAKTLEEHGKTVVAVSLDKSILGLLSIADTLKEDASESIRQMKKDGLRPIIITGDKLPHGTSSGTSGWY